MMQYLAILVIAGVSVALAVARPRNGMGLSWLGGMALVYVGQRLFGGGEAELAATGAGLLVVLASLGLRARAVTGAQGHQRDAQQTALLWQVVGTAALVVWYAGTSAASLGLEGDAADRWRVPLTALFPIVFLVGAIPMLLVDQVLAAHPVVVPPGARRHAVASGLALALGVALVFPVNYLAAQHDVDWDFSYFRVTRPGTSTLSLAANLKEPVEAMLFYPPANDVKEQLVPYFQEVAAASGGKVALKVLDQPMVPALAKELSIRDNGFVVLRQADRTQKFKIDPDLKRARRELKKLDGTVQKHLVKLVKEKRVAYLTTGHGEAGPRSDNPFFKLSSLKTLLTGQNYDVKDLGLEQGSADAIPDDAALVVVAAPEKALLDAEVDALKRYLDAGGSLMVLGDPNRDRSEALLAHLGVKLGLHPLANATKFVPISRGVVDRMNLYSQRYGSHAATSTLSKYATRAPVVLPSALAVTSVDTPGVKHTPLVRSYEDTWEEQDLDFVQGPHEPGGVHVLALAAQGPESTPWKAIVVGDVSVFSDIVLSQSDGAQILALDSVRWLVGDEDIAGEIASEEDVKIEHTREQDQAWFYSTIFGFPLIILAAGVILVRRRTATA